MAFQVKRLGKRRAQVIIWPRRVTVSGAIRRGLGVLIARLGRALPPRSKLRARMVVQGGAEAELLLHKVAAKQAIWIDAHFDWAGSGHAIVNWRSSNDNEDDKLGAADSHTAIKQGNPRFIIETYQLPVSRLSPHQRHKLWLTRAGIGTNLSLIWISIFNAYAINTNR